MINRSKAFTCLIIALIEGFAIFFGVFIVAGVGSYNDWQKEKQFLRLQAESDKDNTVSYSAGLKKVLCDALITRAILLKFVFYFALS